LRKLTEKGRSLKSLAGLHRGLLTRLHAQDSAGAAEQVGEILGRVSSAFGPE
jgi:hypothetical protein